MAEDTILSDDKEYEPSTEPKSSKVWLNLIKDAEKAFADYQRKADDIDRLYADLARLANSARDRQFQLFWANCEVLKPSIYARPPVPVVVPKFKDRRPLQRVSSELLERSTNTAFDLVDINSTMILLRDDVAVVGRGAPWVRYETKEDSDTPTERVCIEHIDRKDFLHDPARKWSEVDWVARRAYLTQTEMRERFGSVWAQAEYAVLRKERDKGAANNQQKAAVWEIWCKSENSVVWVTEGVETLLDDGKPHLRLEGFFPCPKPAYATVQRGSLVPVPDMLFYKDQLEEINQLTARIHALADAIQIKGFYPAGGEVGDAVETALKLNDNRQIMVPVSNFAAFGQGGDVIIWLPIDMIATTLQGLIELRRQVIDDVYQIMGLSDIMRGSTEKDETATAQNLKAQYGSIRIRDKQAELVRVARDLVRISAEIMAENFASETLLDMSQMEIPTNAEVSKQVKELEGRAKAIAAKAQKAQTAMQQQLSPDAQGQEQRGQQALQAAQQEIQQIDQQVKKLEDIPTIEDVMDFLRDQKIRPFALDIETDSTIQPDEDAEKQRRTEFMQAFMQSAQGLTEMVTAVPQAAPLAGEMLRFVLAPYRAGRQMEGAIDDFVDQMTAQASQPKPNPEAEAQKAQMAMDQQKMQADMAMKQQELRTKAEGRQQEAQFKQQENEAKLVQIDAQMRRDEQKGQLELQKLQMELQAKHEELAIKREGAQIDAQAKVQQAQISAQSAQQQADIKASQAEQQTQHSEAAFQQKSALAEQAAQKAAQPNGAA